MMMTKDLHVLIITSECIMKKSFLICAAIVATGVAKAESAERYRFARGDAVVSKLVGATNMPPGNAIYRGPSQPVERRADDLSTSWRDVAFENMALSDGRRINGRRKDGKVEMECVK